MHEDGEGVEKLGEKQGERDYSAYGLIMRCGDIYGG